jgi:predicted ester cyclase
MSTAENKSIAHRFCEELWGKGNLAIIDELASSDLTVIYPILPEVIKGREAFKSWAGDVHAAFPDLQFTIEEIIGEGDKVVISWSAQGTHKGELKPLGFAPTNKFATWSGIIIYHVVNGKVIQEKGEEDALGLLHKIGAIALVS